MLNVLLYLFDHRLVDEQAFTEDLVDIQQQLIREGFPQQDINHALRWLKELQYQYKEAFFVNTVTTDSIRAWLPDEQRKLSQKGLAFLLKLESQGVINASQREVIIDRAMALNTPIVEEDQLKWIALIVLYYYQHEATSIPWLEHVLLNESLRMH